MTTRRRLWCELTLWFASALAGAAASVTATLDWDTPTGRTATGLHYGLGLFMGLDPAVAGNSGNRTYRTNLAHMAPGLIRYHHGDQMKDSSTTSRGWVKSPGTAAYAWDAAKIASAMTGAAAWTPAPTVMMTVTNWPAYLDDGTGKLRADRYAEYAAFCAALVRIVNVEQQRGVVYWEITNEKDDAYGSNCEELAAIIRLAAQAMKAVDPAIKTGAPAFSRPEDTADVNDFIRESARLGSPLDFISYHQYPDYLDKTFVATDATIWDQATKLGAFTTAMQAIIATHFGAARPLETFHSEYNINWNWRNGSDLRMRSIKGAVWDALAMISLVRAGATGATAWNEADLTFGKLDSAAGYVKRPAAEVYRLFNTLLTGTVVATSGDESQVAVFAIKNTTGHRCCLVNRSGSAQTIQLTFRNATPASEAAAWTVHQITSAGLATSTATQAALTAVAGLSLPADSVTVLALDDGPGLSPPTVTAQPLSNAVLAGQSVALAIGANGSELSYQWHRSGRGPLVGATSPALRIARAGADDAGDYFCVVRNAAGTVQSEPTTLSVHTTASDPGRISNLSIRTQAGTGAQTLIMGVVISGAGSEKPVLLRGVGPALTALGLGGALVDPLLTVRAGDTILARNDRWDDDPRVAPLSERLGAFALPPRSQDAALAIALPAASAATSYTVQITGTNGESGLALAELYDATPAAEIGATMPRLINVSARARVGADSEILIAGFTLVGTTSTTVLIRAVGPTLGNFGVVGALADPTLTLHRGDRVVHASDNWSGLAALATAADQVGAFTLPAHSADSCLLLTLPPGGYTALVRGAGNTTGVALVEVYEVP